MPRTRLSTSGTSRELPSDFDIFSPAVVIQALCSQYDANAWPAARDWASSFSWWGKRRSTPPPWMSNAGPRYFAAIAEHSMCQPGRPGPHGRRPGRGLGLEGLLPALPEREVAGVALATRVGVLGGLHVVDLLPRQLAVRRPGAHVEVDVAGAVGRGVGVAARDQLTDQLEHLRHVSGRGRLVGRRQHVDGVERLVELAPHQVGDLEPGPALRLALGQDLVVDVGDVADERDVVARWP